MLSRYQKFIRFLWDSLIVSSALLADCNVLLSEDMQHGQVFNNQLKIVNPFA